MLLLPALIPLLRALNCASSRLATPRRLAQGQLEIVPAKLAHGRNARVQRALAMAPWLLRDAGSGAYFATLDRQGRVRPLQRLQAPHPLRQRVQPSGPRGLLRSLGISPASAGRCGLRPCAEPEQLRWAGRDRYGRPLWLATCAAQAWRVMQTAARRDGIELEAISGFRSVEHQAAIIRRKRARGLSLDSILAVNAAPGYSEHHSGRALDIGSPGEPPAEESFERTAAFAWLQRKAGRFGFRMSYPRDNPFGIVYEPWHWCWHPPAAGALSLTR